MQGEGEPPPVSSAERYTANGWTRQLWELLPSAARRGLSRVDEAVAMIKREHGLPEPAEVAAAYGRYAASEEFSSRRRRGVARLIADRFWDEDADAWGVPADVKKTKLPEWAAKYGIEE